MSVALLVAALRTLIRKWRERAGSSPPATAAIYHQVEKDLADAIADHPGRCATWSTARDDPVRAIVRAIRDADGEC